MTKIKSSVEPLDYEETAFIRAILEGIVKTA
jgi:hypothetical protein